MDDDSPDHEPDDAAIDALIEEFGGDPRAAILALLYDIDVLARDYEANVSRGFARQEKDIWSKTISVRKIAIGE